MKKNKFAFSLLELAVVILIIGVLAVGIMKGTSIINSSRIAAGRSVTTGSHIEEISGMVAWYETTMRESLNASEVSDTSQISAWYDISPESIAAQKNTLTCVASSAITYKSSGINNLPSLLFASGTLSLSAFSQGNVGQSTIFIVASPSTTPTTAVTLLDNNSASVYNSQIAIDSDQVWMNFGSSNFTSTTTNAPSFSANNDYIIAVYSNGAGSKAFVNDAESIAGGDLVNAGTNPLSGLTVGNEKSGSSAFGGMISEIIIYDRPLTVDERKSVMSYLSKKYKIAVVGL